MTTYTRLDALNISIYNLPIQHKTLRSLSAKLPILFKVLILCTIIGIIIVTSILNSDRHCSGLVKSESDTCVIDLRRPSGLFCRVLAKF